MYGFRFVLICIVYGFVLSSYVLCMVSFCLFCMVSLCLCGFFYWNPFVLRKFLQHAANIGPSRGWITSGRQPTVKALLGTQVLLRCVVLKKKCGNTGNVPKKLAIFNGTSNSCFNRSHTQEHVGRCSQNGKASGLFHFVFHGRHSWKHSAGDKQIRCLSYCNKVSNTTCYF